MMAPEVRKNGSPHAQSPPVLPPFRPSYAIQWDHMRHDASQLDRAQALDVALERLLDTPGVAAPEQVDMHQ